MSRPENEAESRLQQAMQQQIQETERKLQEAMQQQIQVITRGLQEAMWQHLQEGERRLQEAMQLLMQEGDRRLQEILLLQEQRLNSALTEALGQMEIKLRENAAAIHTLDQRMREKHLAGTLHATTPTSNTFTSQRIPSSFLAQIATARQQMTGAGQGTVAEGRDEFQKVQHRIKEAKYKMMAAHTTPSRLGEDLHKAIAKGSLKDVRKHLDAGADVNYLNSEGLTPLQRALTIPQREDMVALLWKRGADLDAVNDNGNSAMHVAVWYDFSGRCVSLLISGRADVNARCGRGVTPLHWAADKSNEAAVEALLAAGAKKDLKPWEGPWVNKIPFDLAKTPQIRNLLRL